MPDTNPIAVASPCKQICQLDRDEVCVGCGRTIEEIARWRSLDAAQQASVLERCAGRLRNMSGADRPTN